MLSLTPRFSGFHLAIPQGFIPDEVIEKWDPIILQDPSVTVSTLDYINESIIAIKLPGIGDSLINQPQHGHNNILPHKHPSINVEPNHNNSYYTTANPLSLIDTTVEVSFRLGSGLYNYYVMYETLFSYICKRHNLTPDKDTFNITFTSPHSHTSSRLTLYQVKMTSISGLDFSYEEGGINSQSFIVSFNFNNLDFNISPEFTLHTV